MSAWGNGGENGTRGLPVTESIRGQRAAEAETYASEEELRERFSGGPYGPVKKEEKALKKSPPLFLR